LEQVIAPSKFGVEQRAHFQPFAIPVWFLRLGGDAAARLIPGAGSVGSCKQRINRTNQAFPERCAASGVAWFQLPVSQHAGFRGFTKTECARFDFGDACPTLEQLRGG